MEIEALRELEGGGLLDYKLFEGQPAQGDVEPDATWQIEQEDSGSELELGGVGDERSLLAEAG